MGASSDRVRLGDVIVVGGGCYGSFYARQLLRGRERGAVEWRRLLVVDHNLDCQAREALRPTDAAELVVADWGSFFDDYLAGSRIAADPEAPDAIVPSPLMPHLMYEWLVRRARQRWPGRRVESRPVTVAAGTPYDVLAPDGTRYVSFADWLCPVHCVEPSICPIIRAPRTWEMGDAMHALAEASAAAGPVVFTCRHRVYGVGMFDISAVLAGDETVAAAGAGSEPTDVLVATVSACHGAASLLHLGPAD